MRFISATIKNYRVHRELRVDFDPSRTLIGGPNESGKSTLVEAMQRAFFLRAKITGDTHDEMQSMLWGGTPEVEIVFESDGRQFLLQKSFAKTKGSTVLTESGMAALRDDAAEVRLAELLGVEVEGGGRGAGERAARQWAHLWVRQGQSGSDPTECATTERASLAQRLQKTGGAAAMQSERDAAVAAFFAGKVDETFVRGDNARAGSELAQAQERAAGAEQRLSAAAAQVERLRQAVRDHEEAAAVITGAADGLRTLEPQLADVREKQARVAELQRVEIARAAGEKEAAANLSTLENARKEIAGLQQQIHRLNEALAPKSDAARRLAESRDEHKKRTDEAMRAHEQAGEAARRRRLRHDLAAAWVSRFEKAGRLDELSKKNERIRELEKSLAGLRESLAKLPSIDTRAAKTIQKLETELGNAEAALKAMAVKLEVLAADLPVAVSGEPLLRGEPRVVVEDSEVTIGENIRLRIQPGGGTSLPEARQNANDARIVFQKALDESGAKSAAEAGEIAASRADLESRIGSTESSLEDLGADSIGADLSGAAAADAAAKAEIERRAQALAGAGINEPFNEPAALTDASRLLKDESRLLHEAEAAEQRAKSARDAVVKKLDEAASALLEAQQELDRQTRQIDGLNAQLAMLIKKHGPDDALARQCDEARIARADATRILEDTRRALDGLQPDSLGASLARLERAIKQTEADRNAAENKKAAAQAQWMLDGGDDPQASLALAKSQAGSARAHLGSVRRKAEALRLLNQFFLEEQRALSTRFTQPLADRITGYLQCLFGAGVHAAVSLDDDGFNNLQLIRAAQNNSAMAFGALSGGAKEQVSVAMRLAMAEILAADHGGCLPVVLDDAFAYSDPERVQALQRMLDLAAARGLQVIVLTCTPTDYLALGARNIFLQTPAWTAARPDAAHAKTPVAPTPASDTPDDAPDVESEVSVVSVLREETGAPEAPETANSQPPPPPENTPGATATSTAEQRQQFLAALRESGGKSGNVSLRQRLGWDESVYDAAKTALVASGEILPGKGRGGSVLLPGSQ